MQAARGASLTGDQETTRPRRRLALFAAVAALAYLVDVVTKILAVEHLTGASNVRVVGDVLTLTLVRNPGAAFGTGTGMTWVFSCLAIVAVVVVLWVVRQVRNPVWAVGLGLLLAGVAGNLTDRLLRDPGVLHGHVIDFLRLPNWPVFNVADICINVAAGVIILQTFRGIAVDGSRHVGGSGEEAQA